MFCCCFFLLGGVGRAPAAARCAASPRRRSTPRTRGPPLKTQPGAHTHTHAPHPPPDEQGFLGTTSLVSKSRRKNLFEKGSKDGFEVLGSDVGIPQTLTLSHDGTSSSNDWHVARVELTHPRRNKTFVFVANTWLSTFKARGGACRRELKLAYVVNPDGRGNKLRPDGSLYV